MSLINPEKKNLSNTFPVKKKGTSKKGIELVHELKGEKNDLKYYINNINVLIFIVNTWWEVSAGFLINWIHVYSNRLNKQIGR